MRGIFSKGPGSRGLFGGKSAPREYWFAKQAGQGSVELQPLDLDFHPEGPAFLVGEREFFKQYVLEPALWYRLVTRRLTLGDSCRQSGKLDEAGSQYREVLAIDEENIRANFGIGLVYLGKRELKKAGYIFERLLSIEGSFGPEHKHLFNEFGIGLRKNRLFAQAMAYYGRALALSDDDENLHLNMARACFEKGELALSTMHLAKTLAIEPGQPEARAFLRYLERERLLPGGDTADSFLARARGGNDG